MDVDAAAATALLLYSPWRRPGSAAAAADVASPGEGGGTGETEGGERLDGAAWRGRRCRAAEGGDAVGRAAGGGRPSKTAFAGTLRTSLDLNGVWVVSAIVGLPILAHTSRLSRHQLMKAS